MPDYRQFPLALLRILIGWHFLYEAWAKLIHPAWTSAGYLKSSTGPLAGFLAWLAADTARVRLIDLLNIWGLLLIGLALMLGVLIRPAAAAGIALLALYYFAYPPFFGISHGVTEGSYLIVNKNLVELMALAVIFAFPAAVFGLESLWRRKRAAPVPPDTRREAEGIALEKPVPSYLGPVSRRAAFLSLAGVPFVGAFVLAVLKKHGWKSFEEVHLTAASRAKDEYLSSATLKVFQFASRSDLKGRLPHGRIGNLSLSRMILGGNLIGGWAHARDLIYVSKLVKAYHHREKIFETLALAESCGVNAIITNPLLCNVVNDYWRNGGRIHFISDCGGKDVLQMIQKSIDRGAAACYRRRLRGPTRILNVCDNFQPSWTSPIRS